MFRRIGDLIGVLTLIIIGISILYGKQASTIRQRIRDGNATESDLAMFKNLKLAGWCAIGAGIASGLAEFIQHLLTLM